MRLVSSVDTLLDILGNKTRRRILELLSEEPRYLLQLSKMLGVSMPAIQKHLESLEEAGIVSSFEEESDLGAPPRRYYQMKSSVYLTAEIANGFVRIETLPISEIISRESSIELDSLKKEIESLSEIEDYGERLRRANTLLASVDDAIRRLDDEKVFLLSLKQEIRRIAGEAVKQISETSLERRILYTILGSNTPPNTELISAHLEIRERTVEDVLKELERKGVTLAKKIREE